MIIIKKKELLGRTVQQFGNVIIINTGFVYAVIISCFNYVLLTGYIINIRFWLLTDCMKLQSNLIHWTLYLCLIWCFCLYFHLQRRLFKSLTGLVERSCQSPQTWYRLCGIVSWIHEGKNRDSVQGSGCCHQGLEIL